MLRFQSLKARILVLTTIPLSVLLVGFLVLTQRTAGEAVRAGVQRSVSDAGSVFVKLLATRQNELLTMANVTARDPRFFATLSIPEPERGPEFAPTLQGVAFDFLRITDADFLEVFDGSGAFVCRVDRQGGAQTSAAERGWAGIQAALRGTSVADFYEHQDHLVVAGIVPVFVSQHIEAVLRLGSYFDRQFVDEVKRLTGAEVSLACAGVEIASTYPAPGTGAVRPPAASSAPGFAGEGFAVSPAFTAVRGGTPYLTVRVRMSGVDRNQSFEADLGRRLEAELGPIVDLSRRLAIGGVVAIAATFLAAWLLAERIVRPLSGIVSAAKALQDGDYAYPLEPGGADEIGFLARRFLDMRTSLHRSVERLRSLDQMKSNFITIAGHELRTPLTVISGFNEMLVSGLMGELPEKVQETTQLIQSRLQDLNRLVENILDMSRFEQGLHQMKLETVDLAEIASAAGRRRSADLDGRTVTIAVDVPGVPCPVQGDRGRLEQALLHLVDNAVRFTPDGGRVVVRVRPVEGKVQLAVQDDGIGIPASELEWIFEKAYEIGDVLSHSSGRLQFGSRGFGLGLALCKAIVEAHGGEIRARSSPGLGSEFTIELPAAVGAQAELVEA